MNRISKLALALGALTAVSLVQAGDRDRAYSPAVQPQSAPAESVMLVRVQRLTGIGSDNNRHVLFQHDTGIFLPVDEMGRVAGLVDGRGLDGAYHHLQAELAPEFTVAGRQTVHSRFNATGAPTPIDLIGAVLVMNGSAQALGVAPYYAAYRTPAYAYEPARRYDGGMRGDEDEDEEDDD